MDYPAKKMDAYSVLFQGSMHADHLRSVIRKAKAAEFDEDRVERLKRSLCKVCHYLSSQIGGAAMSDQACGICGKRQVYGSTYTDALCMDCAKEHALCKHCGADRELRPNRRKFAWIKPPADPEPAPARAGSVFILPLKSE